jgi:SAM-dependent methyltransferase
MLPESDSESGGAGLDPVVESEVALRLRQHMLAKGRRNLEKNLEELLTTTGGFVERFQWFVPYVETPQMERMLVSGCAVGSELLVARRFGFSEVHGTEVVPLYVELANARLRHDGRCHAVLYDGKDLPYPQGFLTMVYSGHIIEHTRSPWRYLREHFRVLRPGGYFFLEFPERYHAVELHTATRSFEWLPLPLRNACLRFMASPLSGVSDENRRRYATVRKGLRPVSVWQIRLYSRFLGSRTAKLVALQRPAPGFVRMLMRA